MRGVYRCRETLTTVTTAKVLMSIETGASEMIELISARVTCTDESTNEQLHVKLARAAGTAGGGDALTPKPTEESSAASGVTAKGGNTAITGLTPDADDLAIANHAIQKQGTWEYLPMPEERDIVTINDAISLETKTTLTSCTLIAEIVYREIG